MSDTPWHGPDVPAVPADRAFAARRDRLVLLGMLALEFGLTFFCMVSRVHYSVDSYRVLVDMAPVWHLSLGRYTNFALISLMQELHRNVVHDQRILMLLWIAALVVATYLVTELFCRLWREGSGEEPSLPARLLVGAAASLCWLNVFNLELILFPEMALFMSVGMVALSGSVCLMFREGVWPKLGAGLLLAVALGVYQSLIGSFVSLALMGAFCRYCFDRDLRRALRLTGATCLVGGIVSVFNVVLVKVLIALRVVVDSGRGANLAPQHVLENVRGLAAYQPALFWNADGLMPPLVLALFAVVLAVLLVRLLSRLDGRGVALFCVLAVMCYGAAFVPHVIEGHQILAPRSNVSFWTFLAGVALVVVMTWALGRSTRWERRAYVGALAVILLVSGLAIQDIAQDNYISNEADRMTATAIANRIQAYEAETGVEVTKIAAVRDANAQDQYPEVRYHRYELNRKIMVTTYSYNYLINAVSPLNLTTVDMPDDVYRTHFEGRDWDCLDLDEQLVIEGDTAYLALY